ncbi:MAG: hypothetical protein HY296_02515 [Thaumarchaeota archaeon]|nr:hypothetical protein [Nitrososphaerota archaeon]
MWVKFLLLAFGLIPSLLWSVPGPVQSATNFVLNSPAAGSVLSAGCSTVTITWTGGNSTWLVNLTLYSQSPFVVVAAIAAGIPNSGSFTWTVPSNIAPAVNNYGVYIEEVNQATWTYGPLFTITAPTCCTTVFGPTTIATTGTLTLPFTQTSTGSANTTVQVTNATTVTTFTPTVHNSTLTTTQNYTHTATVTMTYTNTSVIFTSGMVDHTTITGTTTVTYANTSATTQTLTTAVSGNGTYTFTSVVVANSTGTYPVTVTSTGTSTLTSSSTAISTVSLTTTCSATLVSTSNTAATSSSSTSGGGIPEFPVQAVGVGLTTVAVVVTYLALRAKARSKLLFRP